MSNDELAAWVKKEMMSDDADELNRNKERAKEYIRLTSDGGVIVTHKAMTSRLEIALYYIGLAYAKVAGLREDDVASNKELTEKLGLPDGTVHPKIKELRDGHYIEPVKDGVHRINPRRISELLDEVSSSRTG
jgi:hypothetical protein